MLTTVFLGAEMHQDGIFTVTFQLPNGERVEMEISDDTTRKMTGRFDRLRTQNWRSKLLAKHNDITEWDGGQYFDNYVDGRGF